MRQGIMLLRPFTEKRLKKWDIPFTLQEPKLDGVRMRALIGKEITLLSSEENKMNFALPHIVAELTAMRDYLNSIGIFELDGEAYLHGLSFEDINSICSRTANLHPDHKMLQYHVFDHINEKDDNVQRRTQVGLMRTIPVTGTVQVVPTYMVQSLANIMSNYRSFVEQKYEGMVIRHPFANYVRKRSLFAMKFKPKQKDTYRIVGFNEEISKDGVPKQRIGSIILTSDEGTEFCVSAGLNDDDRDFLWLHRDQLKNKNAEVNFQAVTKYGTPKFAIDMKVLGEFE